MTNGLSQGFVVNIPFPSATWVLAPCNTDWRPANGRLPPSFSAPNA